MLNQSLVECNQRAEMHRKAPTNESYRLSEMASVRFQALAEAVQTVYPMPTAKAMLDKASAMYEGQVR